MFKVFMDLKKIKYLFHRTQPAWCRASRSGPTSKYWPAPSNTWSPVPSNRCSPPPGSSPPSSRWCRGSPTRWRRPWQPTRRWARCRTPTTSRGSRWVTRGRWWRSSRGARWGWRAGSRSTRTSRTPSSSSSCQATATWRT